MRKALSRLALPLLLVLFLAFGPDGNCLAAEQMYQISETQLSRLESNNKILTTNNSEQLKELKALQDDLSQSQAALEAAQKSLQTMKEYTVKLEKQVDKLGFSKIAPMIAYGNKSGFMAGLRLKTNPHYDVSLVGNSKAFVMSAAYNF